MRDKLASPDAAIAEIAGRQHGVVTVRQLVHAGVDRHAVSRRAAAGRLHRVYRGVYAVGHAGLGSKGRWMAAVLACGEGAALSHRSAAELWELLPVRIGAAHVTIPHTAGRSRRAGICLHRSPSLTNQLMTRRNGIAVTTPSRTLTDLPRVATTDEVRKAIRQAEFLGYNLGAGAGGEPHLTRSKLERRFLDLCRRHRLPLPEVNARVDRFEVDFLWPRRGLIVETDGYQSHRGRAAFEDDRKRDLQLKLLGYEVVRVTYRQLADDPAAVAAALRALISPELAS